MILYALLALLKGERFFDAGISPVSDNWLADIRRKADE